MKFPPHKFPSRRHGFTLIELMVAMMMVAVLAGSLYATLRIAFQSKQLAETAIEPARTADQAMEIIRQDLTNALESKNNDTTGNPQGIVGTIGGAVVNIFEGTDNGNNDDVVFFTTADSPQHQYANGDIKQVELTMIQPSNSSNFVLVRRVIRNLLTTTPPSPDTEVICRNIAGFNVQYYDGTEWLDTWDSSAQINQTTGAQTLPTAVSVTLELDRPMATGQGTQAYRYSRVFLLANSTAQPPSQ